jgi:TubC N-terminal docking domain
MTASTLVNTLSTRGVRLSVTDGQLVVNAPVDALTEADRAELVRLKPEIIDRLSILKERWGPSRDSADPPIVTPASEVPNRA